MVGDKNEQGGNVLGKDCKKEYGLYLAGTGTNTRIWTAKEHNQKSLSNLLQDIYLAKGSAPPPPFFRKFP